MKTLKKSIMPVILAAWVRNARTAQTQAAVEEAARVLNLAHEGGYIGDKALLACGNYIVRLAISAK